MDQFFETGLATSFNLCMGGANEKQQQQQQQQW